MPPYIVGTGLSMVARGPVNDQRRNIPYMSAVQQSRWARLVNANVSPNWRYSPKEMLENMPLTFGPDGWIFMKNQDKKTVTKKVSFDAAAIGLTDKGAPLIPVFAGWVDREFEMGSHEWREQGGVA